MRVPCLLYSLVLLAGIASGQDHDPTITYLPEDSSKIRVKRLAINSDKSDFSPVLVNSNLLVFASARPSKLGVSYANTLNTEVTDLFFAVRRDSVQFDKVRPFSKAINTRYNEGPFTLSADGSTIYFSGNARNAGQHDQAPPRLQVYGSKKIKGKWTRPEAAPFCSAEYSNCHPAFSKDNSLLVFCSDMPGGYGGTDLYYTQLKNGAWTQPVNLGPKVNSEFNELFPFLADNSLLYFSSARPGGPGGLDIYAFNMADSAADHTLLLEQPINTAADDFGIWIDSTGKSGYFSSSRMVINKDDIYYFSRAYPDFSRSVAPPVKTKFCYTFFEENAYQPNDSVSMSYEWDFGEGNKIRAEKCKYCFNKPGDYVIRLNVVEKNSGEVFYNHVTYTLTVEEPPKLHIQCGDTLEPGRELLISAQKSSIRGYTLKEYYWSFGDGYYNSGMFTRHTYKKAGTYTIELGVTAKHDASQTIEKFKIEKNIVIKDNN